MAKPSSSYTSASTFPPTLLLKGESLLRRFSPFHIQLNLTNQCNLNCSFCSCADRTKDEVMTDRMFDRVVHLFSRAGATAVTITGGGEPLLHPSFQTYVERMLDVGWRIGLVTNGVVMKNWPQELFQKMDWIRVSFCQERKILPALYRKIPLSFSYVYTPGAEHDHNLKGLIRRLDNGELTHLRIVSDIRSPSIRLPPFPQIPGLILQDRCESTTGRGKCWISLVKPVVDVDGTVYPCCGAQYALTGAPARYADRLSMGTPERYLEDSVAPQRPFCGDICQVCYYDQYNQLLEAYKEADGLDHREFI